MEHITKTILDRFDNLFLNLKRGILQALLALLIGVLGWLDFITGFEISFSFFYLIPIAIATWYLGIRTGSIVTVLSITIWVISNRLAGEVYSQEIIRFWNAAIRLIVFFSIAGLVEQFKSALQHEQRLSRTDFLTGITNSREFYKQAELEIKRMSRYGRPLTAAYLDLDSFKQVNDTLGHRAGDDLLRSFAGRISGLVRQTDVFARLGGDEFCLLFPNTDQKDAKHAVDKIVAAVMQEMNAGGMPVTLSIGVVTFHKTPENADELIHKADAIMFQAKSQGKNRAVFVQDG